MAKSETVEFFAHEMRRIGAVPPRRARFRPIRRKRMDQMTRNSCVIKRMGIQDLCYQQGHFLACARNLDGLTS